jgi:hypothetical protein
MSLKLSESGEVKEELATDLVVLPVWIWYRALGWRSFSLTLGSEAVARFTKDFFSAVSPPFDLPDSLWFRE